MVEWPVKPICWFVFPCILINATTLDWMSFVAPLAMYESASVPLFLEEIIPISGGSVAEILMSALAYGWVERCSDIAGCGMNCT